MLHTHIRYTSQRYICIIWGCTVLLGTAVLVLIADFTSTAYVTLLSRHAYQVYESTLHMYHMWLLCSALRRTRCSRPVVVDACIHIATNRRSLSSLFLFFFANKFKISPRWDSNSRTKTTAVRVLVLIDYRGGQLCGHKTTAQQYHGICCIYDTDTTAAYVRACNEKGSI